MERKGINPLELIDTHNKKKEARIKIYEEIFEKCCQKIRYVNDTLYAKECRFTVPYVRWGLPFYHINAVVLYIMIKLRGQGFKVSRVPPNTIYIDWKNIVESFSSPMEFRFEMDEVESTTPDVKSVSFGGDERFDNLEKEGCGGDCCKKGPKHKKINRKQRLELERQHQQDEIKTVLARNGSSDHSSRSSRHY